MTTESDHSPPFCTYERTNSSAFSSSTSSISSRIESTSSDISLWRSATSVSTEASTSSVSSRVRVARCCPPVSLVAMLASDGSRCCCCPESYPPGTTSEVTRTGLWTSGGSAPGDGVDELLGRRRRLEQPAHVLTGTPQRLHRRDAHEILPAEVEHHRVPRRRGHLGRVAPQALPPEVGPGVRRRRAHRPGHLVVGEQPLHRPARHQAVVEPLLGADVGVLEVDQLQPRVAPGEPVAGAVPLEQAQLRRPVEPVRAAHR